MNNSIPAKKPAPLSKASAAKCAAPTTKAPAPQTKAPAPQAKVNAYEQTYIANCRKYTEASNAYYIDSHPIMDDGDFDKLAIDIKAMLALHPELARFGNPTATVQSDHVDGFQKAQHSYPMLSLEDIYTEDELTKFVNSTGEKDFSVECKLDGLSLSLIYNEDGYLIRAVTRGNGTEGDDVTAQAKCIPTIPHKIDWAPKETVEIRGEVVMPWTAFNAYNDACTNDKDKFANPRNAASGTLKSHDPNKCRERGLMFVAYYIMSDFFSNTSQDTILNALHEYMRFLTPRDFSGQIATTNVDMLMEYIQSIKSVNYPFPIDGVVIKCNNRSKWIDLGYTDRFYRWGIAFKFKQESLKSKLVSVDWQVAESGKVTPVANYEPIQMFGTTCRRATLNNWNWMQENGLAGLCIGDNLLLTKGGEIIPKITGYEPVSIARSAKHFGGNMVTPPVCCPVCGAYLHEKGAHLFCMNPDCKAKHPDKPKTKKPEATAPTPPTPVTTTSRPMGEGRGGALAGKTILVSGNFGTPQIRKDIERTVIEQGGTLAKGVSLSVDYYVLPDDLEEWKHKAGSKWVKIRLQNHQSRIITKDQFYSLIH